MKIKTRPGSDGSRSYAESLHRSDDTLSASTLHAGDSLAVVSGKNITVSGSGIGLDKGTATLAAQGDVTIGAATETHVDNAREQHSHSNVGSRSEVASSSRTTTTLSQGSTVSADAVTIASGRDIKVAGSTIVGTNDVSLSAAHDVMITTTQDTQSTSTSYQKHDSGFGAGGGIGISYGSQKQIDTANTSTVTNTGSTVGSLNGNLNIVAGNDLHVTGSDLIAAKNVTGTGANVVIDSATDTYHHDQTQTVDKSGFTLAVKAPVLDAISNAVDQAHAAGHSKDDRAAALHGMAAASSAIDAANGLGALAHGAAPEVKVELSYGTSHSKNTFAEDSTTSRGSNVSAGGTAAFVATGDGTSGSGKLTIAGSNVNATDVVLAAKNQVNLVNTTDTDSTRSTNASSSASVGVSYGTQGFGVSASMAKAHGDANSDAAMQNNTHVTAANTATILSGGDTNIIGANVNGRQVNADIGGNLNMASVQDTMTSSAHQTSTGGGFSISQGGGSASFSHTNASANGSYVGVNEQAGIQAGDGGFNVNVKGNTDLKGATIASTADAANNNFSTGTLTFSDIQNSSSYNAHSGGIGGGVTLGDGGSNYATHGSTSGTNAGGVAPMLSQNDSGSDSARTRSAISAGTISVTDAAHQTQDVASLSRDTTNTNGTIAKLPDVNNLLDRQSDMMAAASAAGEAVSRRVGDFAQSKYKEAEANGDQAGMDAWKEGGTARAEMQAAGAAIVTGLAGGNAVGGAAGAAIASITAGKLNELRDAIAGANPTGSASANEALGNIVANAIATGAGSAIGGNAGAVSGYDVDRFNRQLHPDEKAAIKKLANGDPNEEHRLEAAGCALVHCAAEYAPGTADYAKYSALEQEGTGYTSEQTQLRDYNGTSFSTAGYGGMVRQTSGSNQFKYSADDAKSDNNALVSDVLATQPGKLDYVAIAGSAFGGSASIAVNLHNGNVYMGGGGAVPVTPAAAITFGVIPAAANKAPTIQADKTDSYLGGGSFGGNVCAYGGCIGGTHAVGGDTSIEVGLGFGGFTRAANFAGGGASGFSLPAFSLPGMQPKRN
ncbi:filamentous hemagglutinin family outer membrane protein [Paraburkholderia phenoliruptrix BR3459a]|uniref:Filamentous hemagglutinin family outer membrane protein n=2 Tax=Paraburkholderia phenoliruptrix TaxID=252970 RepID=K0DM21_9BURK|nr:hemagglutinin repeat-containing protein [Paraburkholderia phenoliruptrix]AFT85935.1 filamentous hemagglutinin family outer membrane protein [Paraburkholderia phenoliruptrix BR3459a]